VSAFKKRPNSAECRVCAFGTVRLSGHLRATPLLAVVHRSTLLARGSSTRSSPPAPRWQRLCRRELSFVMPNDAVSGMAPSSPDPKKFEIGGSRVPIMKQSGCFRTLSSDYARTSPNCLTPSNMRRNSGFGTAHLVRYVSRKPSQAFVSHGVDRG